MRESRLGETTKNTNKKNNNKKTDSGKQEKQSVERDCPMYDYCNIRLHPLASADRPNMVAHLGFRVIYTFIAWMVLAKGISESAFFVSVFLFALPVLMDCLKFTSTEKARRWIMWGEIAVSGCWCIIALLGMLGILLVQEVNGLLMISTSTEFIGFNFGMMPVEKIWRWLGTVLVVTIVDWLCGMRQIDRVEG